MPVVMETCNRLVYLRVLSSSFKTVWGIVNMAKKSLFSRISKSLQGPEEKTSEELDRELQESVNRIWDEEVDLLEASSLTTGSRLESGDMVMIMSLSPIYKMIGGRQGRLADSLREACSRIFSQTTDAESGRGSIKGDEFVMRFFHQKENSLGLAVGIINEIGVFVLSERFKSMDIPGLLTVAEVGDLADGDGMLDAGKLVATIKSGGRRIDDMEPAGPGEPVWYKMFHDHNSTLDTAFNESKSRPSGGPGRPAGEGGGDVEQQWSSIDRQDKTRQKNERGPDRRQKHMNVPPRKERRTSWNSRRMQDGNKTS